MLMGCEEKKITKAAKNHSDYYIAYSATTNNSLDTKKSFLLKTCDNSDWNILWWISSQSPSEHELSASEPGRKVLVRN